MIVEPVQDKAGEGTKKKKKVAVKVKANRAGPMPFLPFGGLDGANDVPKLENFGAALDGPIDNRYYGRHHDRYDGRDERSHCSRHRHSSNPGPSFTDWLRWTADNLEASDNAGGRHRSTSYYEQYRPNGREDGGRNRGRIEDGISPINERRYLQVFEGSNGILDELGELGERPRHHKFRNLHTQRGQKQSVSEVSAGGSTELEMTRRPRSSRNQQGSQSYSAIDSKLVPGQKVIHKVGEPKVRFRDDLYPKEDLCDWRDRTISDMYLQESHSYHNRPSSFRRNELDPSLASSGRRPDPQFNPRYSPDAHASPTHLFAYMANEHDAHSKMPGGWFDQDPFDTAATPRPNPFMPGFLNKEQHPLRSSYATQDPQSNNTGWGAVDTQDEGSKHSSRHPGNKTKIAVPASQNQISEWDVSGDIDSGQGTGWVAATEDSASQGNVWGTDGDENGDQSGGWGTGGDQSGGQDNSWGAAGTTGRDANNQSGRETSQAWDNANSGGSADLGDSNNQGSGEQQGQEEPEIAKQETGTTDSNWYGGNDDKATAEAVDNNWNSNDATDAGGNNWDTSLNNNANASKTEGNNDITGTQANDDAGRQAVQGNGNWDPHADNTAQQNTSSWDFSPDNAVQQDTSNGGVPADNTAQKTEGNWDFAPVDTAQQTATNVNVDTVQAAKVAAGRSRKGSNMESKAPSASSSSFVHRNSVPEQPYIKSYWKNINKTPFAMPPKLHPGAKPDADNSSAVCAPSEAPFVVPEAIVREKAIKQYVHAGKGHSYSHSTGTPQYMDTVEAPYAVFRFKYRSKEMLSHILGKRGKEQIAKDIKQEQHDEKKRRLSELSKEQLIEKLMSKKDRGSKAGSTKTDNKTTPFPPLSVKSETKPASIQKWTSDVAAATAQEEGSDSLVTCDICKSNLVSEWWHCDDCSDFDMCCDCGAKGCRCKGAHELSKWKDGQDVLIDGTTTVGPTGEKLSGTPKSSSKEVGNGGGSNMGDPAAASGDTNSGQGGEWGPTGVTSGAADNTNGSGWSGDGATPATGQWDDGGANFGKTDSTKHGDW